MIHSYDNDVSVTVALMSFLKLLLVCVQKGENITLHVTVFGPVSSFQHLNSHQLFLLFMKKAGSHLKVLNTSVN